MIRRSEIGIPNEALNRLDWEYNNSRLVPILCFVVRRPSFVAGHPMQLALVLKSHDGGS